MGLVKVGPKHQVVIPKDVRRRLGVRPGDYVEIAFERNTARIKPKKVIDRDEEPIGPKTRAAIRQALKDVEEGRVHGPFNSAEELLEDLHRRAGVTKKKG